MTQTKKGNGADLSLMEQLRLNYGTDGTEEPFLSEMDELPPDPLPDGYIRRSPVQPYADPPDSGRNRLVIVLILAGVALALILIGIMIWRFVFL